MQIVSKHYCTLQTGSSSFLPFNKGVLSSSVCLPSYLDTIVRAQRGNVFTVYLSSTSFSYGLLQTKVARAARKCFQYMREKIASRYITRFLMDCVRRAARSAENFSNLTSFFSSWRRNRPESVCR